MTAAPAENGEPGAREEQRGGGLRNLRHDIETLKKVDRFRTMTRPRRYPSSEGRSADGLRWTQNELAAVGEAGEPEIAPAHTDGTLRGPTPVWVARIGDDLYVRSYRGQDGARFRATQHRLRR